MDARGLAAAGRHMDHARHQSSAIGAIVGELTLPKVGPVHIDVSEPQPAVMLMIGSLAKILHHRPLTRDDLARSGSQRIQIRLRDIRAEMQLAERLTVDLDAN